MKPTLDNNPYNPAVDEDADDTKMDGEDFDQIVDMFLFLQTPHRSRPVPRFSPRMLMNVRWLPMIPRFIPMAKSSKIMMIPV